MMRSSRVRRGVAGAALAVALLVTSACSSGEPEENDADPVKVTIGGNVDDDGDDETEEPADDETDDEDEDWVDNHGLPDDDDTDLPGPDDFDEMHEAATGFVVAATSSSWDDEHGPHQWLYRVEQYVTPEYHDELVGYYADESGGNDWDSLHFGQERITSKVRDIEWEADKDTTAESAHLRVDFGSAQSSLDVERDPDDSPMRSKFVYLELTDGDWLVRHADGFGPELGFDMDDDTAGEAADEDD